MKRLLCIALVLLTLFSLTACSQDHADPRVPVTFYYRTREYGLEKGQQVISAEEREAFGHREDYVYLVDMYLQGPTTQNCISPFPAGTTLEQLDLMTDKVLIQLSSHISLISGAELTIAGFVATYGSWVTLFTAVAMVCFAFSTILGWGLYGTRCVEFLFGSKVNKPFMLIYSAVAIVGATMDLGLLWGICDTFNGLMAIPNLIAVALLSPVVFRLIREYFAKN
jgi:hypothetical protein